MPTGSNYRLFYPLHYISIGAEGSKTGVAVHGLQSVSMTTSFNLEQVFELGQLDIYENIENLPNVELTAEKAIDGYPLIYHLGTQGSTTKSLLNRTNRRADIFLSVFSDAQDNSSGTPLVQAYCSGMYLNSINYSLPTNGVCTESATFVGNDKVWISGSGTTWYGNTGFSFSGQFSGGDTPAASGGHIQRRQNVKMGNAAAGGSIFPTLIPGISTAGGSGYNVETAGFFGVHISDVSIQANLGREDLYELGRRRPYYRYANFPVAINCTINVNAGGTQPADMVQADSTVDNLSNEPIVVKLTDGTTFDLGTKNKLQSVNYTGGATGGGIVTISYSFENFNKLDVTNPATDPSAFS